MNVVVTEAAYADLLTIGRMIGLDNPARAETFIAELEERCMRLGVEPYAYPLVVGFEDHGIRRRVHGRYLIFYRVVGESVEIIHVLHGALDYRTLLFGEDG